MCGKNAHFELHDSSILYIYGEDPVVTDPDTHHILKALGNLDFFVIRVDWGIGIHVPYETGKGGYFNIPSFGRGQSIHFAIGYPF